MADYQQVGNRYTAIYLVVREKGDKYTYRKLPFELARFNVDTDPDAVETIVPTGENVLSGTGDVPNKQYGDKVYEKIWIVDSIPFSGKTSFGPVE